MFPPNGPRSPSATSLSVRQSSTCTTPKTSTASRWKSELRRELLARFPSTSSPPSACVPKSSASRSTVAQQSFMSRRVASTSMSSCAFPCPPDHTRCAYASKIVLEAYAQRVWSGGQGNAHEDMLVDATRLDMKLCCATVERDAEDFGTQADGGLEVDGNLARSSLRSSDFQRDAVDVFGVVQVEL